MMRVCVAKLSVYILLFLIPTNLAAQDVGEKKGEQEDKPDTNVLVGVGPRFGPAHIGSADTVVGATGVAFFWREGQPFISERPNKGIGIVIGNTKTVPLIAVSPRRQHDKPVTGISKIGFGVEVGAITKIWLAKHIRGRVELRQGIGGHESLRGEVRLDYVTSNQDESVIATIGPRARWGSRKFNTAFFGVNATESTASGLPAYQAKSGIYAVGVKGGVHFRLSPKLGLFGFGSYDRMTGSAARSPLVATVGDKNQFIVGLAFTYRFKIKR